MTNHTIPGENVFYSYEPRKEVVDWLQASEIEYKISTGTLIAPSTFAPITRYIIEDEVDQTAFKLKWSK
jgi:hypothetical protein